FQAEDGIRDGHVTGVQTCALPILVRMFLRKLIAFIHDIAWCVDVRVEDNDVAHQAVESFLRGLSVCQDGGQQDYQEPVHSGQSFMTCRMWRTQRGTSCVSSAVPS